MIVRSFSRVKQNLFATALGPGITTLLQFVTIPVVLAFWGSEKYGEWLLLTSLPFYLALADMGIGTAASNDMAIAASARQYTRANSSLQHATFLILVISGTFSLVLASTIGLISVLSGRSIVPTSNYFSSVEVLIGLSALGLNVIVGMYGALLLGVFRAADNYAEGVLIHNINRLLEGIPLILGVVVGKGFGAICIAMLALRCILCFAMQLRAKRLADWVAFGVAIPTRAEFQAIIGPSIAYLGFPFATAMTNQGLVLVTGWMLDPVAVVTLSTCRIVTRSITQVIEIVRSSVWPELTVAISRGELDKARSLHRMAFKIVTFGSLVAAILVSMIGGVVIQVWTAGKIKVPDLLLSLFLVEIVLNAIWSTSSVVSVSVNLHAPIARLLSIGSVVTIAAYAGLVTTLGLHAAPVVLAVLDLTISCYVLPKAWAILHDSARPFFSYVFSFRALPHAP